MTIKQKALIAPINSQNQLLLQDRRGHKPPPWGYFGGGIEAGETPQQAVIRETREELGIKLNPADIAFLGQFDYLHQPTDTKYIGHVYVWETKLKIKDYHLIEGADLKYVTCNQARELLSFGGDFDILNALEDRIINQQNDQ